MPQTGIGFKKVEPAVGKNEKRAFCRSFQASFMMLPPMYDSSFVSPTRWASLKRPSWNMQVRPMSSRRNIFAQA